VGDLSTREALDAVKRDKKVVDSPDSMLVILGAGVEYAGHPYQNDPRGTVASIGRITLDDVRKYHQQLLQTSRLLLVVVGDIDPGELQKKVAGAFSKLPVGNYQATPPPPLVFTAPTLAVTKRDIPTNYVEGTYSAPSPASPDIYPMRVATSILRNRIFEEVRQKRNLSYAPDASLNEYAANTGGIYVTAVDANQSVKVMFGEIEKLQTENIDSDEIRGTAQSFLTQHYLDQETNAAQAGELAR
jgi:zinc protease